MKNMFNPTSNLHRSNNEMLFFLLLKHINLKEAYENNTQF